MQSTANLTTEIKSMKITFLALGIFLLLVTGLFYFMFYVQNVSVEYDVRIAEKSDPLLSFLWILLLTLSILSMVFHNTIVNLIAKSSMHSKQISAVNWSIEKYHEERFSSFRFAKLIGYGICEIPAILSLIGFLMSNSISLIQGLDFNYYFLIAPIMTAGFIFLTVPDEQILNEVLN